jgi:S-adenosylmethionine decarboxylase
MAPSNVAVLKKKDAFTNKPVVAKMAPTPEDLADDHFITDEFGNKFAGRHLIIDLHGVKGSLLADQPLIERMLREATEISGATLLNIDLHCFEPNGGISGVAVLAESHISIHTWPERGYAAIDTFMCGNARPERSLQVMRRLFKPQQMQINEVKRGMVTDAGS